MRANFGIRGLSRTNRSWFWLRAGVLIGDERLFARNFVGPGRPALAPDKRRRLNHECGGVRGNESATPITARDISLFDNGAEQAIKSFVPDRSAAHIVLLVDNSLTIRADVEKLEAAAREFAYEIYDGDKLLIVGYDDNAEIVSDWTDDSKKIEVELKAFRKKGDPHLFDAILAVVEDGLRPLTAQKRASGGDQRRVGSGQQGKVQPGAGHICRRWI
jgi:hypothetical protein